MASVDVAAWAAGRGWTVVKIVPGKKKAAEAWRDLEWRSPDEIRRIWNGESVGILTGPSGLVCDDLDVDEEGNPAGDWALEWLAHDAGVDEVPQTFTLATPSGGTQLIWQAPNGADRREFKTCAGVVAPHFDVRGRGGLFVLHEPGQPGRFVIDDRKPVLIPDWLAELHPEPGYTATELAEVPSASMWVEEFGDRDDGPCWRMAGIMDEVISKLEAGSQHDAHDNMISATLKLVGERVKGHHGLGGALSILQRAFEQKTRGMKRHRDWKQDFWGAVWGAIRKQVGDHGEPRDYDSCSRRKSGAPADDDDVAGIGAAVRKQKADKFLGSLGNGAWLSKQKFAPLQYSVPGLLPEGYAVLAGGPFTGKSVLLVQFGLACARGAYVFGVKCPKRHVYYLALETSEPRLQELCLQVLGHPEIPRWFNYELEVPPKQLIPRVETYLKIYPDALIMIDTLSRVMGPPIKGETTYDRDYRIGAQLKDLDKKYTGCTIIASRHTRKGKADDWTELVSGTNAITGAADTLLILSRMRGTGNGTLQIASRVMKEAEYSVILEEPLGWHLDGEDLDDAADKVDSAKRNARLSARSNDIIDLVCDSPNGITPNEVADKLGIDVKKVNVYLSNNANSGHISRVRRGVYGPPGKLRVSSPSSGDDDD